MRYFDLKDFYASVRWLWKDPTREFENDFARYIGAKYAIGTSLGTTALYLGLRAIDAENREVIIPAFTCAVVRYAVVLAGAKPRFVNININDLTFDLEDLRQKITGKTVALILTHYFGRVARNIKEVETLARKYGLILIEDCAHSLGAEFAGKKVGNIGDFAIFSLSKGILNAGGGVLVTNNDVIYRKAKTIISDGKIPMMTRIADFPLVIASGLQQLFDKLIIDRVKDKTLVTWVDTIPKFILAMRNFLLLPWRMVSLFNRTNRPKMVDTGPQNDERTVKGTLRGIAIEPILASLAQSQLKKIDVFIRRRKHVHERVSFLNCYHFKNINGLEAEDAYTHIVLRFAGKDVRVIKDNCEAHGLFLRFTWPAHQSLWEEQDIENVRIIGKEFLTLNVNPNITCAEIDKLLMILVDQKTD